MSFRFLLKNRANRGEGEEDDEGLREIGVRVSYVDA